MLGASLILVSNPVFADSTNGVEIQNIQVQPSTIKVGDPIRITATLFNNSTVPIFVSDMINNDCQGPFFTVSFDNHVKVAVAADNEMTCSYVGLQERLDPGKKYTGTSPGLFFTYTATQSGTANVTVTFPYEIKNQTDPNQSNIDQTISKSFLFTISDNNTTISIPHSEPQVPSLSTPLYQFKSGIAARDVTCKPSLQLIIKSEDNSPACVKPDTAKNLYERGWTSSVLSVNLENNMTSNRPAEIVSIKPSSSLANPGGSSIQLTLKNMGSASITSLKATLHINHDYVFDFKNVSESRPFLSDNLASDTKILIGSGFSSELTYPITMDGVANNVPFSYTQNISIPFTNENLKENSSGNSTVPDSFVVCDTPYDYKQGFIPILYVPPNSDGRICVNYWNPDNPKNASLTIFDAKSHSIEKNITTWAEPDLIPIGNSTVTYTIKTGNQTGFYGVTVFCTGMPLAIGYDNNSNMSISDFPWEKQQTTSCPLMDFQFKVLATKNIGIKYIPDH